MTATAGNGKVLWITGLSGAGKTTLAQKISEILRDAGYPAVILDGDTLRDLLAASEQNTTNHGRDGRLALAYRYSELCRILATQGLFVVIATISLFCEVHEWNRKHLPGYFEVYLKVTLDELRRRDPKGIYRRFDAGELDNVVGLDLPVDEPINADMVIENNHERAIDHIAQGIIHNLLKKDRYEN